MATHAGMEWGETQRKQMMAMTIAYWQHSCPCLGSVTWESETHTLTVPSAACLYSDMYLHDKSLVCSHMNTLFV